MNFKNFAIIAPGKCPPGQVYDECAIECDHICLSYLYVLQEKGKCNDNQLCQSGCVSAEKKLTCPPKHNFANNHTCVAINLCVCATPDGIPIKVDICVINRNKYKIYIIFSQEQYTDHQNVKRANVSIMICGAILVLARKGMFQK